MLGYDHDSFWQQTPRTLEITFDAHAELQVKEHNERAWLAWHVAALPRAKNFPNLRKMQVTKAIFQSRREAMDKQIAGLVQYVKATGGKVVYRNG